MILSNVQTTVQQAVERLNKLDASVRSQLDHLAASSSEQKQTYQELAATLQSTQDISTQARQAAESAESVAREAQSCIEKACLRSHLDLYKVPSTCLLLGHSLIATLQVAINFAFWGHVPLSGI